MSSSIAVLASRARLSEPLPISPLYLPYISPMSPLYLPYISRAPSVSPYPNP